MYPNCEEWAGVSLLFITRRQESAGAEGFSLGESSKARIGFESQSPAGDGAEVAFSETATARKKLRISTIIKTKPSGPSCVKVLNGRPAKLTLLVYGRVPESRFDYFRLWCPTILHRRLPASTRAVIGSESTPFTARWSGRLEWDGRPKFLPRITVNMNVDNTNYVG
jgi:hypothetical protein